MNLDDEITLIGYLEDALAAEHGIKVRLESAEEMRRFRQKLYSARAGDSKYLTLVLSEHESHLWIIKKESKNA